MCRPRDHRKKTRRRRRVCERRPSWRRKRTRNVSKRKARLWLCFPVLVKCLWCPPTYADSENDREREREREVRKIEKRARNPIKYYNDLLLQQLTQWATIRRGPPKRDSRRGKELTEKKMSLNFSGELIMFVVLHALKFSSQQPLEWNCSTSFEWMFKLILIFYTSTHLDEFRKADEERLDIVETHT